MWQKDNWGEFEVEWQDPDRSLERAEVKVAQLEKDQEDIFENGKKVKELVDKCKVNNKLRLDAMENEQQTMKTLSIGLGAIAAMLGVVQLSNRLFKFIQRRYLRRVGMEEDALTEQPNRPLDINTGRSPHRRRSRRMKRSHARQWQIEGVF
jgi:hypothetical protein